LILKDKSSRDYTLNPTARGPANGVHFTPLIYVGETPSGVQAPATSFAINNLYTPVNLKRDPGGSVRIYGATPATTGPGNTMVPTLYTSTQPANVAPQAPSPPKAQTNPSSP
jgi:hypothetical protein